MKYVCFPLFLFVLLSIHVIGQGHATTVVYNGHKYDIYTVQYPKDRIAMWWKDSRNRDLLSIGNLKEHIEAGHHKLLFATNAGMYTQANSPKGLYIENGVELVPIDLKTNKSGNFYLQPNGVFLLTKNAAEVVTTAQYRQKKRNTLYATQSGPMLVVDAKVNSLFTQGSRNVYIRSGVGIANNGAVVFVISQDAVNFYDIAELFKTTLNCSNALYLDGAISKMYLPAINRTDTNGSFGAMIGVWK